MADRRVAIVGTAQTWKLVPFDDVGLEIWSLNDAYRMPGFIRGNRWYDFHPLNRFYHPKGNAVAAHEIPPGYYCRPADHLDWMGKLGMPLFLHPGYVDQHPAAKDWPHAHPFPKAEIEAYAGRYFTSSPAWMLAHAMMEGVRDIHVYGIHLATEHEYIEQRPNFEFLLGRLMGPGKMTQTVKDGLRHYDSQDAHLVFPEASPVLHANFQYAFDTRPRAHQDTVKWDIHRFTVKRERAVAELKARPWWKGKGKLTAEIAYLEATIDDGRERLGRLQMAGG